MSLVLISLSLLANPAAQAQQSPTHCWNITYLQSGTWSHSARDSPNIGQTGPVVSDPWPASYNPNFGGFFGGAGNLINGDMEGIVVANLTWVPATGKTLQTDPPSEPVYIIESASATASPVWGGSGTAQSGQGIASDGLGDTQAANGNGVSSSGTHLTIQDGSKGVIVLVDTLKAVAPTSNFTFYQPSGYGGGTWNWKACSCTVGFSVAIGNPNLMDVIATRVDATDPHNAKVYYHTVPENAVVQTATFTAPTLVGPAAAQTLSNVCGEFCFTFDEGQLPLGSSTFTLQWTPASPFVAVPGGGTITTNAINTSTQVTGSSPLFYIVTAGGISGGTVVTVPATTYDDYEYYNKFAYSLPVVAESKTIWVGGSSVNLGTPNSPNLVGKMLDWGETHYYQDDFGTYASGNMQPVTGQTIPSQSYWFLSDDANSSLFFAPNHNLMAVSHCDTIVFAATSSPAQVLPFSYLWPTITVPIN